MSSIENDSRGEERRKKERKRESEWSACSIFPYNGSATKSSWIGSDVAGFIIDKRRCPIWVATRPTPNDNSLRTDSNCISIESTWRSPTSNLLCRIEFLFRVKTRNLNATLLCAIVPLVLTQFAKPIISPTAQTTSWRLSSLSISNSFANAASIDKLEPFLSFAWGKCFACYQFTLFRVAKLIKRNILRFVRWQSRSSFVIKFLLAKWTHFFSVCWQQVAGE